MRKEMLMHLEIETVKHLRLVIVKVNLMDLHLVKQMVKLRH
jgi:hypothetical protein